MRLVPVLSAALALLAAAAPAATGEVYRAFAPGAVRPAGFVAAFAKRLAAGATTNGVAAADVAAPVAARMADLAADLLRLGAVTNADALERLAYNDLPSLVSRDGRGHVACAAANRLVTRLEPGSAGRAAFDAFIARMWAFEPATGGPVALLHGASSVTVPYGEKGEKSYRFESVTGYPFADTVTFVYHGEEPLQIALGYRIPGWCMQFRAGHVQHERRVWRDGDAFTVRFRTRLEVVGEGHLHRFVYGSVVFGCPLRPTDSWNWAVDLDRYAMKLPRVRFTAAGGYPFDTPAMTLDITADAVAPWGAPAADGALPPPSGLMCPLGRTQTLRLVPVGAALSRLVDFPDLDPVSGR